MVTIDEKRRRSAIGMRIVIDFNPKPLILHSREDVDEYLERHCGPLPSAIKVEWCYPGTNHKASPLMVLCISISRFWHWACSCHSKFGMLQCCLHSVDARCVAVTLSYVAFCAHFSAFSYSLEDFFSFI